jgi:hypothetical protein
MTEEMPEAVFEQLKIQLEETHDKLEALQKLYQGQTGLRWIPPLRLNWPKKKTPKKENPSGCSACSFTAPKKSIGGSQPDDWKWPHDWYCLYNHPEFPNAENCEDFSRDCWIELFHRKDS